MFPRIGALFILLQLFQTLFVTQYIFLFFHNHCAQKKGSVSQELHIG